VVQKTTNWWDEYGEWVHGALDAAGFIPGVGEIADGLNGVIYLAEGNYLEAGLSVMSMIPLLGDLGKAGKWTAELGQEVVDTVVEKVAKEVAGEALEKTVKESLEEGAIKVLKESSETVTQEIKEEIVEKLTKEGGDELTAKSIKETNEEVVEILTKETVEEGTEKAVKEVGEEVTEKTTKEAQKELTDDSFVENVPNKDIETDTPLAEDTVVEEVVQVTPLVEETTQRVLNEVIEGKVTKLPKDIAENLTEESATKLAAKISEELGGKKVWVSASTGSIYVSKPPAAGFLLAEQLSKTDLTKRDEVEKILKQVAELTSRGSGNHVILGPFKPNGTFIQKALDTGGVFWDVGDELWEALEKTGVDMFKANDQFLRLHIENGIERFDVIHTNVSKVINDFNSSSPKDWTKIKYTEKEILDLASMPNMPYQLVDNSWIKVDLINSMN
jgi:Mor family transcriptional regulator